MVLMLLCIAAVEPGACFKGFRVVRLCLRPLNGGFTAMANARLFVSIVAHNVDLLVVTAIVIVSQLVHLKRMP